MPAKANTPVMGEALAMTISLASWARKPCTHGAGSAVAAARAAVRPRTVLRVILLVMTFPPGCLLSGTEGPKLEPATQATPDLVEAQGLEHEEADDEGSEHDCTHGRKHLHDARPIGLECGDRDLQ